MRLEWCLAGKLSRHDRQQLQLSFRLLRSPPWHQKNVTVTTTAPEECYGHHHGTRRMLRSPPWHQKNVTFTTMAPEECYGHHHGTRRMLQCYRHIRWNPWERDYTLITNLMHWLLLIRKILLSSTCFEHQVLIFRRTQLYTSSIWYCHSL